MAEEGINSETAFSQDTTLFDSLRERRREAIDRTLTQISSQQRAAFWRHLSERDEHCTQLYDTRQGRPFRHDRGLVPGRRAG